MPAPTKVDSDNGVAHPLQAELLQKALAAGECAAIAAYVLTHQDDARVALQRFA